MKNSRRWNVLQFIYKLEVGGAERVVCALAKGLTKSSFNTIVASCKGGPLVEYLRGYGVPVHVLGKKGKLDPVFFVRLVKLLRSQNIHILHTHTFTPNLWGRLAAILVGKPIIITTEHTIASHKKPWQRRVDKFLSRFSDKIIAVSNEVKNTLVHLCNIDPLKIEVIHNGIDEKIRDPINEHESDALKNSLGIKKDIPIILTIGRLSPAKGHSFLLEAVRIVNNGKMRGKFILLGDGPLKKNLEQKALELGVEASVSFQGFREDVQRYLQIADVVVFPSVREGFSVALLEAMAAGKPIIATDVGGNKEAIESDVSGVLVPKGDSNALAEVILQLLTNREKSRSLAIEARKKFESQFRLNNMITKTEAVYTDLIERGDGEFAGL